MKTWVEFVASISKEEWVEMIGDTEKFSKDGFIGECCLRQTAQNWMDNIYATEHVTMWMRELSFEAYKYFAYLYLKEHNVS